MKYICNGYLRLRGLILFPLYQLFLVLSSTKSSIEPFRALHGVMTTIAPQDAEKKVISDSDSDDAVLAQLGYTQGQFALLSNVLVLMTDRAKA